MGKRRTRKQKLGAKHQFNSSWSLLSQKASFEPDVKGQIKKRPKSKHDAGQELKKANILAKEGNFEAYRRDTLKSLVLASIILVAELVIYLAWNVK